LFSYLVFFCTVLLSATATERINDDDDDDDEVPHFNALAMGDPYIAINVIA